jgi:hypothetical protein
MKLGEIWGNGQCYQVVGPLSMNITAIAENHSVILGTYPDTISPNIIFPHGC